MNQRFLVSRVLKPVVFVAAAIPLAALVWDGFTGELGANPVEEITHRTGQWGLRLLLITLCVTPLRQRMGWPLLGQLRRMLGLYAFFYVVLHFSTYFVLDAALDLAYIFEDVVERLYITAGFTGFMLLIPLAITSTNGMLRRLGPKRWQRLHRLIYFAAAAGVLHFWWLVKADVREPLVYALIFGLLMLARLGPVLTRRQRQPPSSAVPSPKPEPEPAREPEPEPRKLP